MLDPETFLDSPTPPLVLETLLTMIEDVRALLLKQQAELHRLQQQYAQLASNSTLSNRIARSDHTYPWQDSPFQSSPYYAREATFAADSFKRLKESFEKFPDVS